MSNDIKRITDALAKAEGSSTEYSGSIPNAARTLRRVLIQLRVASVLANGSNAITANTTAFIARMPCNGRVIQAHGAFDADATAHASNNAQINVIGVHANGVIGATKATANTAPTANGGTGSIAKGSPVALTVGSQANARFVQGSSLAATVTQNASGVAMGNGTVSVVIELEGPIDEAN